MDLFALGVSRVKQAWHKVCCPCDLHAHLVVPFVSNRCAEIESVIRHVTRLHAILMTATALTRAPHKQTEAHAWRLPSADGVVHQVHALRHFSLVPRCLPPAVKRPNHG